MTRRRVVATAAAVAAVAAGSGIAWAFWSSSGVGAGSATTGSLSITTTALVTGDAPTVTLVPAGTGDVVVRVHNGNTSAVHVASVQFQAVAADSSHSGCTGVTVTAPTSFPTPQFQIAAGQDKTLTFTGAAAMAIDASSNCQGATFTVPITVVVQS